MEKNIKLSLIVPTLDQNVLSVLINSISELKSSKIELIVINQSRKSLTPNLIGMINIPCVDFLVDKLPAASARNLGASLASGEYVFFLDDDAVFYSNEEALEDLLLELYSGPDVLVVQRGEVVNCVYISHWPTDTTLNLRNFSRFAIEWNLILKKSIFNKLGGFPEIGTGSHHAALSGEAFVLMSKIIGAKIPIILWPDVKIAHPGLFEKSKPLIVALGYWYGAGYAVGLSLASFRLIWKVYWISRILAALLKDLLFRKNELIPTLEKVSELKYSFILAKCRLYGFLDAIMHKSPRPLNWLDAQTGNAQ
jgi:glycosyltransferase involved in cell wall biosynthesis